MSLSSKAKLQSVMNIVDEWGDNTVKNQKWGNLEMANEKWGIRFKYKIR